MTSTDWGPVDSNTDHCVTAPDLFGGEHFGDELMAMYNSAADVGHEMTESGKFFSDSRTAVVVFCCASSVTGRICSCQE